MTIAQIITLGKTLTLIPGSTPTFALGEAISQVYTAAGGTPPYTLELVTDDLPAEWTVPADATDSVEIETPATANSGVFSFTYRVIDALRGTALITRTIGVAVVELEITGSLAAWAVGTPVSDALAIVGGSGDYSITSISVPDGVTYSLAGGIDSPLTFAGSPTGVGLGPGTSIAFNVTVTVQDSSTPTPQTANFSQSVTITVPALAITGSPTNAEELIPYAFSLTRTGGVGDITETAESGFPAGISAAVDNPNDQVDISGTPPTGQAALSPFSPSYSVIDSEGNVATWNGTLVVDPGVVYYPPTTFAGLKDWLDFTDATVLFQNTAGGSPVNADGQNLYSVGNKASSPPTGAALWIANNTGTNFSIYKTNLVNGKSGVQLRAATSQLFVPQSGGSGLSGAGAHISASGKTLMMVFAYTGTPPARQNAANVYSSGNIIGDGPNGFYGIYLRNTATPVEGYNWDSNSDAVAGQAFAASTYGVAQYRHNGTQAQVRINGGAWVNVTSGATTGANGIRIGMNSLLAHTCVMNIIHACVYNVALSDANADALRDWAMHEIGLI